MLFISETPPTSVSTTFLYKWHVGLGFLGEQGVESVHARLNSIKANIRGFNDDLAIWKSVLTTHWLQTRPDAHSSITFIFSLSWHTSSSNTIHRERPAFLLRFALPQCV